MSPRTKTPTPPDYTGGLTFFPWLWNKRKMMIVALAMNVFFGYKAYQGYLEYGKETPTLIASIFFGIGVPAFILFMLIREHRGLKKGIVR